MFPYPTRDYIKNMSMTYGKYFPNSPLRITLSGQFSNLNNLRFGKLGVAPINSFSGAMSFCIYLIPTTSIPPKILKKIISTVSVIMTTLHSKRAGTNKNRENKSVDFKRISSSVFTQRYYKIALCRFSWLEYSLRRICKIIMPTRLSLERSYSPPVTHFVARIIRNCFPNFGICDKLGINHNETLLHRVLLWPEPVRCSRIATGSFIYNMNHFELQTKKEAT